VDEDRGFDEVDQAGLDAIVRTDLVLGHQAAVVDHVGGEDRRAPPSRGGSLEQERARLHRGAFLPARSPTRMRRFVAIVTT